MKSWNKKGVLQILFVRLLDLWYNIVHKMARSSQGQRIIQLFFAFSRLTIFSKYHLVTYIISTILHVYLDVVPLKHSRIRTKTLILSAVRQDGLDTDAPASSATNMIRSKVSIIP